MAKHVLIVEDEEDLATALKEHLSKRGCDVKAVSTAEDALSSLEEKVPNLILLDVVLPGMNGFDFLDTIRKNPEQQNITVIMLSNLDNPEDLKRAHHYDVREYLIKTDWRLEDVVAKVEKAL